MPAITSEVKIVNLALLHLGHQEILAFEDQTKEGQLARSTYFSHRDSLLRGFTWNFALKRTTLTQRTVADEEWGYDYAYNKPANCLRVVRIDQDRDVAWAVEGQSIVTDLPPPLKIKYIRSDVAVGHYDAFFVQALAAKLAAFWAEPLGKASTLQETMAKLFAQVLGEAVSVDSVEKTPEVIDASEWLLSRIGAGSTRWGTVTGQLYGSPGVP